jgi:hypothetical protein
MNVLVIGATPADLERLRAIAGRVSSSLDVFDEGGPKVPDWVLTATSTQREVAVDTYRLPPHRVVQMDVLLTNLALPQATGPVHAIFANMAGIGAVRPSLSSAGISIARLLVPWLQRFSPRVSESGPDRRGSDAPAWPETAAVWTTGHQAHLDSRAPRPVMVGAELDHELEILMRKRARRFARLRAHWDFRDDGEGH